MLGPKTRYRMHEWLAEHCSFIQYPKPLILPLDNRPQGLSASWRNRPKMHWAAALFPPLLMLLIPAIGVYMAMAYIAFLFLYFKRT